jgi:hypothetical protein
MNDIGGDFLPQRPFMEQDFDSNYAVIGKGSDNVALDIIYGADVDRSEQVISYKKMLGGQLSNTIVTFDEPPNAQSTIDKKGFNDPLVWNDELQNAVHAKLRKKSNN